MLKSVVAKAAEQDEFVEQFLVELRQHNELAVAWLTVFVAGEAVKPQFSI